MTALALICTARAGHEPSTELRAFGEREDALLAAADEVDEIEADADLTAITARSLLVSGRHDLADFRQIAVDLSGLLPDSRHIELDWAGHLPSLERPAEFNPILDDFWRGVRGGG